MGPMPSTCIQSGSSRRVTSVSVPTNASTLGVVMEAPKPLLAGTLLLAACSPSALALPTLEPPQPGVEEACPQELFGPVVLRERLSQPSSPVVAIGPDGIAKELVWERTFDAQFSPLVVRDPSTEVVARADERVWLIGGGTEGGRFYVCELSVTAP
jgi:hypothetical protein